jgi:hypothetical protein
MDQPEVDQPTTLSARTQSFALQPTRATLAARSLAAVNRITDTDERRAAFRRHLADFPPLYASV